MSYSRDIIAEPRKTPNYKRRFFFPPLSLLCKFKLYKSRLNHVAFLKIDKRVKLLKVNILSDAEWLFAVTPKGTCSKIMSYFIRNQTEDYKAVRNGIIPQA